MAWPSKLSDCLELAYAECSSIVSGLRLRAPQLLLHRTANRLVDLQWFEVLIHENEDNGIPFVIEPNGS